jgi:hypothetical protein
VAQAASADARTAGRGRNSRHLEARARGEDTRLGRRGGADTEGPALGRGARARATSRRDGALAQQRVDAPLFEHEYLQKMTRHAQSFEYESCRAHLGECFS